MKRQFFRRAKYSFGVINRCALLLLMLLTGCRQGDLQLEGSASGDLHRAALPSMETAPFSFKVDGHTLSGLLDQPAGVEPTSTIIIVHGYGKTDVVAQNWYYDLRSRFASIGINTLMWDKPGCGESEGEFDINQPVQHSAEEVVAAVKALQNRQIKGSERIGLWGISRAGWIAPLAIQEAPAIDFWISISGTDDKENGRYLIESNLRIEGRTEPEVRQLISEWQASFDAVWQGGSYEQYREAAPNLHQDPFMELMGWAGTQSEQDFLAYQQKFLTGELTVDTQEGLMIYVPDFEEVLSSINIPVLALFGEKDTNVDWRKTAALYQKTIGANPAASLTLKTFPEGNHILKQSETGGVREMREQAGDTPYVDGYYEAMLDWLVAKGFGS